MLLYEAVMGIEDRKAKAGKCSTRTNADADATASANHNITLLIE